MGGLFGLAIASALFAVVGTTLRGILRPISWSLLTIALGLLASSEFRNVYGQETTSAVDVAQSPSPTTPTAPTSPSNLPLAQEGWQDVAEDLEPLFSDAIADSAPPSPPSPDDLVSVPERPPTSSPTPSPTIIAPVSPNTSATATDPSDTARSRQVEPIQEPIQGFW